MKRALSFITICILLFCCANSGASSLTAEEGYNAAVKGISKRIDDPETFIYYDSLFKQLNSEDFDTSSASFIAFFNMNDGSIMLLGKIDDEACRVASWKDIEAAAIANECKLFLENYSVYQLQSTGNILVVIDKAEKEAIAKTFEDVQSLLEDFDGSYGTGAVFASAYVPSQIAAASYKQGDTNGLILQIKQRMQELGYFSAGAELSGSYNSTMAERIRLFQKNNGLEQTGVIDSVFLSALYGPMAIKKDGASASASDTASANTTRSTEHANTSSDTSKAEKSQSAKANGVGTESTVKYIGNKNTKKFHRTTCGEIKKMKESNKVSLYSRDAAISGGYVPCKKCNP